MTQWTLEFHNVKNKIICEPKIVSITHSGTAFKVDKRLKVLR